MDTICQPMKMENKMTKINSFEDLECWQEAKALAVDIYKISSYGNLNKDFSLKNQLRKSAISIASNVSEGKERETLAEFIRFLYISKGSTGELKTQLYITKEIGYLNENDFQGLMDRLTKISAMIGALIKSLKKLKSP